ncbi:MAG: hypothetical protein ACXVJ7_07585 [Acidimicrobiia bacterium]
MMVIGAGRELWRVEIVLWVAQEAAGSEPLLIEEVRKELRDLENDDMVHLPVISNARSYDIQPVAPDESIGVSCWVAADTVGDAAASAWEVVRGASGRVIAGPVRLWDVRVIPRTAVMSGPGAGTPLTRRP